MNVFNQETIRFEASAETEILEEPKHECIYEHLWLV